MKSEQKKIQIDRRNWLSKIPEEHFVYQLSIPGTHDSAAFHTSSFFHKFFTPCIWKTQDSHIQQQLQMGIRFFDIRVRCEEGQRISLCHGPVHLGMFKQIIDPISNFLKYNKSEFVILLFQKEQGSQSAISSGQKIINELMELTKNQIEFYKHDYNKRQGPRLKQLRSKLWLIEAYPGNHNRVNLDGQIQIPTYCKDKTLTDGRNYIIQNFWEGPEEEKKEQILKVINHPESKLLKVNFIIQSNFPRFYSKRYNKWMESIIGEKRLKKMGILIFDFPHATLIDSIIKSNYDSLYEFK